VAGSHPTLRTVPAEGGATLPAEFHALGILNATARAVHGYALRHGCGAAGCARQTFQCAPLTSVYGMRCQYSGWGQVSSEKHETGAQAGVGEKAVMHGAS